MNLQRLQDQFKEQQTGVAGAKPKDTSEAMGSLNSVGLEKSITQSETDEKSSID